MDDQRSKSSMFNTPPVPHCYCRWLWMMAAETENNKQFYAISCEPLAWARACKWAIWKWITRYFHANNFITVIDDENAKEKKKKKRQKETTKHWKFDSYYYWHQSRDAFSIRSRNVSCRIRAPTGLVFNFMSEVQTPNESHAHTRTLLPLIYSDSGPHLDASINLVRVYVCVCFFSFMKYSGISKSLHRQAERCIWTEHLPPDIPMVDDHNR